MAHLRNLPAAILASGRQLLASRPPVEPDLLGEMDTGLTALLEAEDQETLHHLAVLRNGVVGHYHQGKIAEQIKNWGAANGRPILIAADIDVMVKKVNWVRRRTPGIALSHLRALALMAPNSQAG